MSDPFVVPSPDRLRSLGERAFGSPYNPRLSSKVKLKFGRKGSKSIEVGSGLYYDFEAGAGGGLIELFRLAGEDLGTTSRSPIRAISKARTLPKEIPDQVRDVTYRINDLWHAARPIAGTLAEAYLTQTRGIDLAACVDLDPDVLRFHPACPVRTPEGMRRLPALLAEVSDIHTAKRVALHRTFLDYETKNKTRTLASAKMCLGPVKGGCIRLVHDAKVTEGLGLAEGIETALSLMAPSHKAGSAGGFSPVWATISAGGMAGFPTLSGIEYLTLFADHGKAGEQAALACGERWQADGKTVRILPHTHDDFNADTQKEET